MSTAKTFDSRPTTIAGWLTVFMPGRGALARHLGVTRQALWELENHKHHEQPLRLLRLLAAAMAARGGAQLFGKIKPPTEGELLAAWQRGKGRTKR